MNAFATAGGRLYVTDSLVGAIGGSRGVIAFILGHELSHNLMQHGIKKYLRQTYRNQQVALLQRRIALGDKNANWELLAFVAADKISSAKIDRDEENAADHMGLMICAEAGYHPDFAIFAARSLRDKLGEQSKFGAFFSDHPRWTTREERAERNSAEASVRFTQRWPSLSDSPGGVPPPLAGVSEPAVRRVVGGYMVSSSVFARNMKDHPMDVRVELSDGKDQTLVRHSAEFSTNGSDVLNVFFADEVMRKRKGHQFVQIIVEHDGVPAFSTKKKQVK